MAVTFVGCNAKDSAAQRAAPRLTDRSFESHASAICSDTAKVFDGVTTLPKIPSKDQSANLLLTIDARFAAMVAQLRDLKAAPADQAAVTGWLSEWDQFVAFGRHYADVVRVGGERDVIRDNATAQGDLRRRLQAFAVANHMSSCRFN